MVSEQTTVSVAGLRGSPQAAVMAFLNEVAADFPAAIPLAAGRPSDRFLGRLSPAALARALARYLEATGPGSEAPDQFARLLQYGRTAGIVGDLIAQQLRIDTGVRAQSDRLIVTTGAQEGLSLCLSALCPAPQDVALVANPTYVGATGAARAGGVALFALPDAAGDLAAALTRALAQLAADGRRPRVLYLIPDFDNPTGRVLEASERRALIEICARHRIAILEDSAYRMFRYDGVPVPTMAELDTAGCVIHLASYAKTLAPALRIGALALPETMFGEANTRQDLFQELCQRKSFLTVNTSPLAQALAGGILLEHNGSLANWVRPPIDFYRGNRDALVQALATHFAPLRDAVDWNHPEGGFFLAMNLPFRFDAEAVRECAAHFGVIVVPMAFFALDDSQDRCIRLSFSAVDPERIHAGVAALRGYVAQRLARMNVEAPLRRGATPCSVS